MKLEVGKQVSGFTLRRIRDVPGQDAALIEMVYDKTGTELCWYQSREQNKLFSIAFHTLPENDTGVFHILEHSVLCGSEKYPVKEPFVELMKSSMNTFLNAMTFPDKTIYPVSSRNEQDFLNLTSVYLDAVFAPRILTEPNIFYQEGWHYEIGEGGLSYNGVVFNEMKGAMSSVNQATAAALQRILFPDTAYRFVSGGDPAAIPNLTYEQFLSTYRENYHPSNARIYLDGDVPIEKVLSMLDGYLSRFDMGRYRVQAVQAPVTAEGAVYYEVSAGENLSAKAQYVLGKVIASFEEKTKLLAVEILCDVLCGSNDAPLKRAILNAGLGQDVTMQVTDGVAQPWLVLQVHNTDEQQFEKLRKLVLETVRGLVRKELNKEDLTASINALAFRLKEMQEPQGLIRCINSLGSWLYGGDPMQNLFWDEAIGELHEMVENGAFNRLLEELLLDGNGLCALKVLPSVTYGEEVRASEAARLQAAYNSLTSQQREELKRQNNCLNDWQQTPDSPEQLERLPVLDLAEISEEPVLIQSSREAVNGVTVLRHTAATNGIVHLSAYFSLADCTLEKLTQLSLLGKLLGSLSTAKYTAAGLQNEIKSRVGDLSFGVEVFARAEQQAQCNPFLAVHCSVLWENLPQAEDLIYEILTATDLDQPDQIRQILMQAEIEAQQMGMMNGHSLAASCALAHFSAKGAADEAIGGISRIRWIKDFASDFDERFTDFYALTKRVLAHAVCANRMTVSVTEDRPTDLESFLSRFPAGGNVPAAAAYKTKLPMRLGIQIPAQVSYAAMGYQLGQENWRYQGDLRLLANVLSLECLWNNVRVQGGAYGAGMQTDRSGNIFCYSYRDPSPARSLNVYRSMPDFAKQYCEKGVDLTKYIISTVAGTEPLQSPRNQGRTADARYFAGLDTNAARKERREILHANVDKLLSWLGTLDQMGKCGAVCVVGHADALNACESENLTIWDL